MLLARLHDLVIQSGVDKHYLVAYSGGMDSHVLLALCVLLRQQLPLRLSAVHVHHGMSPHADAWARHCEQVCETLQVPFACHQLSIACQAGDSLEEQARIKRYEAIAAGMTEQTVLLTAHHQDDQAETFLLQLMRGAGLKGLSAMPLIKQFAAGWHARPLLSASRAELLAFAQEQKLSWVDDESNANDDWSRNYLRRQVMPLLMQRWPSAAAMIARSASHCAEAEAMLEDSLQKTIDEFSGSQPQTLSVSQLKQLPEVEQKRILRTWIHQQGYVLPSIKKLAAMMTSVLHAAPDRQPEVTFGAACIRRFRDDLYLLPRDESGVDVCDMRWDLLDPLVLPNRQTLVATKVVGQGVRLSRETVDVRYRQGGEIIYLPGRGHRALKKMFNEWGVQPWERARVPLVFLGDLLIAVVGYYYHPECVVQEAEVGVHFQVV